MSLNWNVTDVKNYKRVVYKKSETDNPDEGFEIKHYPNRIIWATMAIGMSSITEENHVQFYNRVRCKRIYCQHGSKIRRCFRRHNFNNARIYGFD